MRRLAVLAFALCVSALFATSAFGGSPTIAARTAIGTLSAENAAFNASNWKALWSAYTASYRTHCGPYATFAKNLTALHKQLHAKLTTKITAFARLLTAGAARQQRRTPAEAALAAVSSRRCRTRRALRSSS